MNAATAAAIKGIVEVINEATKPQALHFLGGMTPKSAEKLESLLHDFAEGVKLDAIEP